MIRRRLLQNAINKQRHESYKFGKGLELLKTDVRSLVTGIDWFIIYRSIDNNVSKKKKKVLPIQEKKLKSLTFNNVISFTSTEVVKNISLFQFSTEDLKLLKYGLSHSIPSKQLRKPKFSQRLT